jgi:HlyD family secretion protein
VAGIGLIAIILAVPTVLRWSSAERSVAIDRLRFATVERGTLVRDAPVQGRVVAAVSPTLYAPAGGTVTLQAQAGRTVAAGELLAQIESPELENELARQRATLEELEVEVSRQRIASARQELETRRNAESSELALAAAKREQARAEDGWSQGTIPQIDLLRARDVAEEARIAAAHAQRDAELGVEAIRLELRARELQLSRQRLLVEDLQRRVGELAVRSPVDGMVGNVAVIDRAVVAGGSPLLTVVDLRHLEVELEVPASFAADVGIGMPAEVRIGTVLAAATVTSVSPEVVGNQVLVRVGFAKDRPEGLRQNQRVSARIVFEELPDVLTLARGPFVEAGGGRYAYVVEDQLAVRRPIRLGAASVASVEVLEGLEPGEQVVIGGTDHFEDAERVRLIP